jgi:pimeloyl-ACP methyl ester carboxylesterase
MWLSGDWWSDWHKRLVPDYNVLVFDVPGYGESPISTEELAQRNVHTWSSYILSLLDEMNIEIAYFVGESTGGGAVLCTAIEHPERIRAGVIISTPFKGSVLRSALEPYPQVAGKGGLAGLADYLFNSLGGENDDPEIRSKFRQTQRSASLEVILHDGAAWLPIDLGKALGAVQTPILILAPGHSPLIPREHSFALEALLPNSSLILMGRASHSLAFTEADAASFLSRQFFERWPV